MYRCTLLGVVERLEEIEGENLHPSRYLRCTREIHLAVFQPKKFNRGKRIDISSRFSWRSRMRFERKKEIKNLVALQSFSTVQR